MSRDWLMNCATNLKQQWINETKSWPPGFYILAVRQQGGNQQTSSCNIISFKKTKEGNGIEQDEGQERPLWEGDIEQRSEWGEAMIVANRGNSSS